MYYGPGVKWGQVGGSHSSALKFNIRSHVPATLLWNHPLSMKHTEQPQMALGPISKYWASEPIAHLDT